MPINDQQQPNINSIHEDCTSSFNFVHISKLHKGFTVVSIHLLLLLGFVLAAAFCLSSPTGKLTFNIAVVKLFSYPMNK
jgi:hypothetical protein